MAVSQWKLNRMELGEADLCKETITANTYISLLDLLWKAQTRMERSYARAHRELQRLQSQRNHQPDEPVPEPKPAADAIVGQPFSPAESALTAGATRPTYPPPVELDPRTLGRPQHRPDCPSHSERDTVVTG